MSLVLLGASAALAASPVVRVAGLGTPRAVALLVQRDAEVAAIACNDAGAAPDAEADGIWACGPLPPVSGPVRFGIVKDGRLLDAGSADLGGAGANLSISGGAASVVASLPAPADGAHPPAPAAPTVVARVTGLGEGSAPVVRLQGPEGAVELMCRDDGVFPDNGRNDGVHGCAGPAPGARAEVFVNGKDGATRSFGKVAWDLAQPLAYLVVDGAAGAARVEVFPLDPFPVAEDVSGTPPAPPPPVPPAQSDPPPPESARERSPVATREALPTAATSPFALVAAFVLGAGGVFAWSRRAARLPALLRPHPAPPLLPGGPGLSDLLVAIGTSDPTALAALVLPALARHRRVVVVAAPEVALPPVGDGPVYRFSGEDCQDVEAAVRVLSRAPGPPVAVLIVGDCLADPGAIAPDPLGRLRDGLGGRVWLGALLPPGAPVPSAFVSWTAEGPPWALSRATGAG